MATKILTMLKKGQIIFTPTSSYYNTICINLIAECFKYTNCYKINIRDNPQKHKK